jgi:hypothetical protein
MHLERKQYSKGSIFWVAVQKELAADSLFFLLRKRFFADTCTDLPAEGGKAFYWI